MDLYDEDHVIKEKIWYFIKQTQGVIGFLGGGDHPLPLSDAEVDDLMFQVEGREDKAKPKIQFEVGETVRIKDGAFENFEGTIEEIDSERGKLKLMVSISDVQLQLKWSFGRLTGNKDFRLNFSILMAIAVVVEGIPAVSHHLEGKGDRTNG